jgi:dihydropyrimidinase
VFDLLIRGGLIVSGSTVEVLDLGAMDGRIAAVGVPGALGSRARRVIDARGRLVTPGGVEAHAHIGEQVLGEWSAGSRVFLPTIESVSRAAVFGGTTTVASFVFARNENDPTVVVESEAAKFRGRAHVDYTFHCALLGKATPRMIDGIGKAVAEGIPTFKVFMARDPFRVDNGSLSAIMEAVAANNGLLLVHAEDHELVSHQEHRLREEGRNQAHNIHLAHSKLSEELAFASVVKLAKAHSTAVYFVHVTASEGVAAIRSARSQGLPIYGEVLHNYLCFTSDDYRRANGMIYHTYPALKYGDDQADLWVGLSDGCLSVLATDEFTTSLSVKTAGTSIDTVCGGHAGIETRGIIGLSEGVHKGRISLLRFVEVFSANPARLLGVYPAKGVIAPGSDADLVVWETDNERRVSMADLHHDGDYSIWTGRKVWAWPAITVLRGRVVVEDRQLMDDSRRGQWLSRHIAPDVVGRAGSHLMPGGPVIQQ